MLSLAALPATSPMGAIVWTAITVAVVIAVAKKFHTKSVFGTNGLGASEFYVALAVLGVVALGFTMAATEGVDEAGARTLSGGFIAVAITSAAYSLGRSLVKSRKK